MSIQQVSAKESVTKCKTIGTHLSNKIVKVLFYSGSTKTMIHLSDFETNSNELQTPSLMFQTLGGKVTSNKAVQLTSLISPMFISKIFIDTQVSHMFDKICWYNTIVGAFFLDNFGNLMKTPKSCVQLSFLWKIQIQMSSHGPQTYSWFCIANQEASHLRNQ